MKNTIINFILRNSEAKVNTFKMRTKTQKTMAEELNEPSYNPKTERLKSLKMMGFRPISSL